MSQVHTLTAERTFTDGVFASAIALLNQFLAASAGVSAFIAVLFCCVFEVVFVVPRTQ